MRYCYADERAVKREQRQAAHDRRVEALYGLERGEYRRLYEAQGGKCAIRGCRVRGISSRALAVDHDHTLGLHNRDAVRGLICRRHNLAIGYEGDDPEVFEAIARYLREPPARMILNEAE